MEVSNFPPDAQIKKGFILKLFVSMRRFQYYRLNFSRYNINFFCSFLLVRKVDLGGLFPLLP